MLYIFSRGMAPSRKRGRKQIMAVAVASSGNRSGVSCRNCTASPALSAKHSGISCRTCSPTPASFGKHSGVSCHTSTTASPLNGNSLLSTPIKVLRDQRKSKRTGDPKREGRELRALVNCVVSVSAGVDEKPLNLLKDLLENGISPNTGIDQPEVMKIILIMCFVVITDVRLVY